MSALKDRRQVKPLTPVPVSVWAPATAPGSGSALRAAIYTRVSQDPGQDRLAVQRQEQLCRELAMRRGWQVVGVYEDDDVSAYNGRVRPDYRRLLEDIAAGTVNAVIAWHADRMHRSPKELEAFIDVVEQAGCAVETVQAGTLDLSTPSGRAVARTLGAWARYESEHRSERLKAKHRQLAQQGRDGGSGRPFGYELDRQRIRPKEAALIRQAADRILAGESLRSVVRDWNTRGIRSATGRDWSVVSLKRMLVGARISGRREYATDARGKRLVIGPIVAVATWPAIVDVATSDRLRAMLTDPARKLGTGMPHKYLLTGGLAVCGVCGAKMMARPKQNWKKTMPSTPSIVCSKTPGHLRISAEPLDAHVGARVMEAIDKGALARALQGTGEDKAAVVELAAVEQKLADLADDWASDRLTRGEWEAARKTLRVRQEGLKRRVESSRRGVGLDGLPDPLRAAWPSLPLHRRRAVISAVVEAVVIGPGVVGLNQFDKRRVTIRWKV